MKLSKLIHQVWADERVREMGLRKHEVTTLVKVFLEHIKDSLLKHKKVKLQGLFTLEIRKIKGRKIRNPQTQEYMYSRDYHKIGLIPSEKVKKGLRDLEKDK